MIRQVTVKCPHCEEEDTTNIELEDYSTEYYVVTECVSCAHPYVLGVTIQVTVRTGVVEMQNA